MKMSIGDIVDRYSICKLKTERLGLDNSKELSELKSEIDLYDGINEFVDKLYDINGKIWDLESDIRKGNEDILGLEEVGRRAIQIRGYNGIRVGYKNDINSKYNEGFVEVKMNHGSEKEPSVVISLTTVPERLANTDEDGLKLVLKNLCEQEDNDYEVHFNLPEFHNITKKEYIIPDWLNEYKLKYKHFKVFRVEDVGPPTKFVPTIQRIQNPETIIITVDDDLVYHTEMVAEHRKYQESLKDSVICYEGRGCQVPLYNDIRDSWIICVTEVRETHGLQHYKSASYKVKLFTQDFYDFYFGRTLSDDILVSRYFRDSQIKMYVVPFEKDNHLYETKELWDQNQGVIAFPILRYASSVPDTGCNDPEMLKVQPKFYEAPELGRRANGEYPLVLDRLYDTDKFNHGYIPLYEKHFSKIKNCKAVLEIGVYNGESLRYLSDYFQDAMVYGVDIHDKKMYDTDKIKTFIADQENVYDLNKVILDTNCEFDLIIDDGGHTMKQQQVSFGVLFKHIKSGGIYILEDLHTSNRSPWMTHEDKISSLDMLREFQKTGKLNSQYINDEQKTYIEENVSSVFIWSATDDYQQSVTSIIIKK